MKMTIARRLLRLLDPEGEKQRMQVRRLRCVAEANAEDLVRTISVSRDQIKEMVRKEQSKTNGKSKGEH